MYIFSQGQIFIIFFILGICIGVIFDIFRSSRKVFKTSDLITSIEDVIFIAIVGILIVNTLVIVNNGQIRFYIVISVFFGISFYFLTISKICSIILQEILKTFRKIIYFPIFLKKIRSKKKDFE